MKFAWTVLLPCAVLLVSCDGKKPAPATLPDPPPVVGRKIPLSEYERGVISVNGHKIDVYIARNAVEQAEGLMFTEYNGLGKDEGMIFVFDEIAPVSFWMRNTIQPLDIAFIKANGVVANIRTMQAMDETSQPSEGPVKYAVEVHDGWYKEHGVKAGAKFDLGGIKAK